MLQVLVNFYVIVVGRNLHPSAEEYVLPNNAYSFLDNCQSKKCLMIFLLDISLIFLKYQNFFFGLKRRIVFNMRMHWSISYHLKNKIKCIKSRSPCAFNPPEPGVSQTDAMLHQPKILYHTDYSQIYSIFRMHEHIHGPNLWIIPMKYSHTNVLVNNKLNMFPWGNDCHKTRLTKK